MGQIQVGETFILTPINPNSDIIIIYITPALIWNMHFMQSFITWVKTLTPSHSYSHVHVFRDPYSSRIFIQEPVRDTTKPDENGTVI